jgi:ferritin-like metal-binding protein YciE
VDFIRLLASFFRGDIQLNKITMEKSVKQQRGTSKEETKTLLEEFFIEELKDIYWAEKHLVKALPKMQKAATSEDLAQAFADHLTATEEQVARLEQIFELFGQKAKTKKCEAMEGLVREGEAVIKDTEADSATRDVALIMAAQKIEHYEIATYGGLAQLAKTIGRDDVKDLLGQTLDEEKEADELLSSLAESSINEEAVQEGESEGKSEKRRSKSELEEEEEQEEEDR